MSFQKAITPWTVSCGGLEFNVEFFSHIPYFFIVKFTSIVTEESMGRPMYTYPAMNEMLHNFFRLLGRDNTPRTEACKVINDMQIPHSWF